MKPESQNHKGRRIEIRRHGEKPELLIDNVAVDFGRLPNGMFFLDTYAYDWTDDLMELARRYIDYRGRVEKILGKSTDQKAR